MYIRPPTFYKSKFLYIFLYVISRYMLKSVNEKREIWCDERFSESNDKFFNPSDKLYISFYNRFFGKK